MLLLASSAASLADDSGGRLISDQQAKWHTLYLEQAKKLKASPGDIFDCAAKFSAMANLIAASDDATKDAVIAALLKQRNSSVSSGEFSGIYVDQYVVSLARKKERAKTEKIIAEFEPSEINGYATDTFLASSLPDGILIVFDICERPHSTNKGRYYVQRLRLDFPDISKGEPSDDIFLRKARNWYLNNDPHLEINRDLVEGTAANGAPYVGTDGLFLTSKSAK